MKQKISLFLLLVLAALGVGSWRAKAWFETATLPVAPQASPASPPVLVEIPSGTSAPGVGTLLAQKGLIRSTEAWQWWTRIQGWKKVPGGFQAGTYAISPNEDLNTIAQKIWSGKIATRSFTVPEGWSIRQMAAYFEQQGMFPAQEFLAAVRQVPAGEHPWLPANLPHVEGFLYPDTYQLGAVEKPTAAQIVKQMLDRFQELALPVYEQQQGQSKLSLLQWVTLASIVEKEAVVPQERGVIAGVFTNRLKTNMPLGSDPTVEYGLGIRQTKEQPLTFAQVDQPTPYNTYMNPGLPPTPISSPGLSSLKATLQPDSTEYLFFVARYDGTHVFSKTNAEHLAAQDKIRDKVDAETAAQKPPSPQPSPTKSPAGAT
jgi:UPF0755 protein